MTGRAISLWGALLGRNDDDDSYFGWSYTVTCCTLLVASVGPGRTGNAYLYAARAGPSAETHLRTPPQYGPHIGIPTYMRRHGAGCGLW